jgi:hypothetical protein
MSYSPRVTGTERADFFTIEDLLSFKAFKGKKDQDFAIALWKYFADKKDGSYHFWGTWEQNGYPEIRFRVNDPLKFINVYGWMICGNHSMFQHQVQKRAGYRSRQVGIVGHSICEIYYKGAWHLLDIDMHSYYLKKNGVIASVKELTENPEELILNNKSVSDPNNLPDRPVEGYYRMYRDSRGKWMVPPDWNLETHTMTFYLRPGESILRSTMNEGKYDFAPEWLSSVKQYNKEWHGYPRERYAPFRTFGNGKLVYKPDLASRSEDVAKGIWEIKGITQTNKGLKGPGYAIFRFQSPYLFTGKPVLNKKKVPHLKKGMIVHEDGPWAWFKGKGNIIVDASKDGNDWKEECSCRKGEYEGSLDLTMYAQGRYEFYVRIRLGDTGSLSGFSVEAPFMVAPISVPRLKKGKNILKFKENDQHGLPTVPYVMRPDFRNKESIEKGIGSVLNGTVVQGKPWSTIMPVGNSEMKVVIPLKAPEGKKIASFYAWCSIFERDPKEPDMQASIEYSLDRNTWKTIKKIDICASGCGWDTALEGNVKLETPADMVYVRISSPKGIAALENRLDLLTGQEDSGTPRIICRWKEGKKKKKKEFTKGLGRMEITCKEEPEGFSYEIIQPSAKM